MTIDLRAINERSIILADRLTAECERRMGDAPALEKLTEHQLQTLSGIIAKMQRSNVTAIRARMAIEKDGKGFQKNLTLDQKLEAIVELYGELTHEQRADLLQRLNFTPA